jgi:hypothetical protein
MKSHRWLAGMIFVLSLFAGCGSTSKVATTPVSTHTPTAIPPTPYTGNTWFSVPGLNFGKSIAFSLSDSKVGYVCGNMDTGSGPATAILLSQTTNGGLTWSSPVATSIVARSCEIYINPTTPQDIIIHASSCIGCDAPPQPYRSLDGGQSWQKLTIAGAGYICGEPVWLGTSLYFAMLNCNGTPVEGQEPVAHHLAVSQNGKPLEWTSEQGLPIPTKDTPNNISSLAGVDTNLYITINNTLMSDPPLSKVSVYISTDGQHWSPGDKNFAFAQKSTDGKVLYKSCPLSAGFTTCLNLSHDNGKTWTTVTNKSKVVGIGADGTLYIDPGSPTKQGMAIDKLSPDGKQQTIIQNSDSPRNVDPFLWITSDSSGRTTIWASFSPAPGIANHAG